MTTSSKTIIASFEITRWDETTYREPEDGGAKLGRITVGKRFHGPLEGTSTAELLTAISEGGRGYVASELVEGVLEGRRGSFVLQHFGIEDRGVPRSSGHVVAGSGTGALRGLRGELEYAHDAEGARLTLTYSIDQ